MRARRRISTFTVVVIVAATSWTLSRAQEYLPPKTGGGKKQEAALPANYDFSYEVQDSGNSVDFGHNEKMKDGTAIGSYHVLLPDGRMQLVEYVAGPDGFKPVVTYMGEAVYPPAPPREEARAEGGYRYSKAASNRQSVRQPAPKPPPAQTTTPADPPMD